MLVTPYMMMKIFASVNFLKQKYKPAVRTKDTTNHITNCHYFFYTTIGITTKPPEQTLK